MEKQNNILILCSWSARDPLVHRYVLPNVPLIQSALGSGCAIHLLTAESTTSAHEDADFIRLMAEMNITWVPSAYAQIGWRGWLLWGWNILKIRTYCYKNKIHVLHAFAPVAGALAWMASRFSSRKLVIDSWEPHADAMVETGVWTKTSKAYKLLFLLEKKMAKDANYLIAAHPSMMEYSASRYQVSPSHIAYKPACIDLQIFDPARFDKYELRKNHGFKREDTIGICVSQLGGMYYFEETLLLMSRSKTVFGDEVKWILLTSTPPSKIDEVATKLQLDLSQVTILKSPPEEVPLYLAMADFAYNPQMYVPSKRFGTPVKNGEYWAMGLPILLMPDTSQDSQLAEEHGVGVIMKSTKEGDQLAALSEMKTKLGFPQMAKKCRQTAAQYRDPALAKQAYEEVYTSS